MEPRHHGDPEVYHRQDGAERRRGVQPHPPPEEIVGRVKHAGLAQVLSPLQRRRPHLLRACGEEARHVHMHVHDRQHKR